MNDKTGGSSTSKYKKSGSPRKELAYVNKNVHDYLDVIQSDKEMTNAEMARLFNVDTKYYETIKRNGGPLDYDRLYTLYKELGVNPLKLLMDDPNARLYIDEVNEHKTYKETLEELISQLKQIEDENELLDKIMSTYDRLGKYQMDRIRQIINERTN